MRIYQPSLQQFVAERLGQSQSPGQLLREMLVRAFGAPSFDQFWRSWNPVYGYYLYFHCYRPLRRVWPRWFCVCLTFAASGFFLHDLPFGWWIRLLRSFQTGHFPVPFVTLWFCLMGGLTVLSRGLRWNAGHSPAWLRVGLNAGAIVVTFIIAWGLAQLVASLQ
jgi:MBOAT, membrane-bound O-acyltransferase family